VAARERNKNLKREKKKKKVGNLGIIVQAWWLWFCLFPWFCCSFFMFPGFDASLGTFSLFFTHRFSLFVAAPLSWNYLLRFPALAKNLNNDSLFSWQLRSSLLVMTMPLSPLFSCQI
jgi:hypothetical protein